MTRRLTWTRAACVAAALALPWWPAGAVVRGAAPRASAPIQLVRQGDRHAMLLNLLASARQRVLVEAFALSDAGVIAALESARQRGVDVRVMLDPLGVSSAGTTRTLAGQGVLTRPPNPAYGVTHLNVLVVDAGAAVIVTGGFTSESLAPGSGTAMVIDRDRTDVLQAASLFYDDWLRRPVAVFSHNLLILPDSAGALTSLIGGAQSRIEMYTSKLSDPGIIGALRAARDRGAVLRILTPPTSINNGLRTSARTWSLRFRDDGSGTLLMIDRRVLLVGSMDLTSYTLTGHRELGVLFTDRSTVNTVNRAFFSQFNHSIALSLAPVHKPAPKPVTVHGSLPITLTVSPVTRVGGEGVVVVTTVPAAHVKITIAYPRGSKPAAGTTGTDGTADLNGSYTYRWIVSGRIVAGTALVQVAVQRGSRSASATSRITVVK